MMKSFVLALALALGVHAGGVRAGSDYTCPGSAVYMHAWAETTVTTDASCAVAQDEILARIDGQYDQWSDPHNNGTYSVLSSSSDLLELQRATGDGKYTDKIDFAFSASGSGCQLMGCSESQVNSIADFSTNFCNQYNLFCGANEGCAFVHTDLAVSTDEVKTSVGASSSASDCS